MSHKKNQIELDRLNPDKYLAGLCLKLHPEEVKKVKVILDLYFMAFYFKSKGLDILESQTTVLALDAARVLVISNQTLRKIVIQYLKELNAV